MTGSVRRLAWFTVVACTVALVVLVFAGRSVFAKAAGENDPLLVRDSITAGSHRLSGMIEVPSSCDELQERVRTLSSTTYEIVFSTRQEPSAPCEAGKVPRPFRAVVPASGAGAVFTATLDGAPLPILILPAGDH